MILAVKLKNAIKKEAANNNMELVFSLKNIIVNPPRPSAEALWTGLPISSVQVGHEYKRD